MNARRQAEHLFLSLLDQAIDTARDDGRPPGPRVHAIRTSLKRGRALLELLHPLLGRRAREVRRSLMVVARSFSSVRDAVVLHETFDRLRPRPRVTSAVRARLEARQRDLEDEERTAKRLRAAARTLRATRRRAKGLLRRGSVKRAIAAGFIRSYRRARRAMKGAYRNRTSAAFHAWRQAVKIHAFHVAVLDSAAADRAHALDALGALLGDAHDLALLEQSLRGDVPRPAETRTHQRLLASARAGQRKIYGAARPLGERLFAARPKSVLGTWAAPPRRARLRDEAVR